MVSVSYSDVHNALNLTVADLSAANTENMIDNAIDTLNLLGNLSISNMSGAAGSKTVTLTQKERAAVLITSRVLYYGWWLNINPMSAGDVGVTPQNLFDNQNAMRTIRFAANQLNTYSFERV